MEIPSHLPTRRIATTASTMNQPVTTLTKTRQVTTHHLHLRQQITHTSAFLLPTFQQSSRSTPLLAINTTPPFQLPKPTSNSTPQIYQILKPHPTIQKSTITSSNLIDYHQYLHSVASFHSPLSISGWYPKYNNTSQMKQINIIHVEQSPRTHGRKNITSW